MKFAQLDRAFYIVVCKETDELYAERIHFDKAKAEALHAKARRIASAKNAPAKLSNDASFWLCKFCQFWSVCHGTQTAKMSCRTCLNSKPPFKGSEVRECGKCADDTLGSHLYDPQFIGGAKKIGVGGSEGDEIDCVIYDSEFGRFANETVGKFPPPSVPSFVSRDLQNLAPHERVAPISSALHILGGSVVKA
jgi:hypothetical protein